MAHIADLMVEAPSNLGLNNHLVRDSASSPHHDTPGDATPSDEKEKYVWRMHQQPSEPRKYQLFPQKDKLSIAAGRKTPELEIAQAMAQNASGERERSILGAALRLKSKEQTLIRRRKASVPELGPMTTVQEVPMDSPTIPGRPPLHERSISAPGNSWRQHMFGESMLSCISGPALDENAELAISEGGGTQGQAKTPGAAQTSQRAGSASPKQRPLSPKSLTPLVIPASSALQPQRLIRKTSSTRLRSESLPPEVPPKSARMTGDSPKARASPFTPMSSTTNLSTAPTSVSNTPLSALPGTSAITTPSSEALEGRSSPKPWTGPVIAPSPMGHSRGQSVDTQRQNNIMSHRRGESEASIMDRGRPKMRTADGSPIKRKQSTKRSASKEQLAFEFLPTGIRATDASSTLPASEVELLRKQAVGQASRFEVLSSKDVEALSRELRGLDERCEYLRKTHRSLRSGRRNLHERICTYLRSPRLAQFSNASMLKQEEALAELDTSIDDWVSKLEVAENRRTRVRQKLLEHVAAALIIPPTAQSSQPPSGEHTPPRSPIKAQSPQRLTEEVQVSSPESIVSGRRGNVESIRIYADSDVYALLADVEDEINRMGDHHTEADKADTQQQGNDKKEKEERAKREENAISAGITLNATVFSGVPNTRY